METCTNACLSKKNTCYRNLCSLSFPAKCCSAPVYSSQTEDNSLGGESLIRSVESKP